MSWMRRVLVFCVLFLTFFTGNCTAAYERIVSLSPAITEIIYALEADQRLIGVSSFCDYPRAALSKEDVGGFINPNLEKIISLRPELVILSPNSGTKQIHQTLTAIGIKTAVVSFYTIDGLRRAYTVIGEYTDSQANARRLIAELDEAIRETRDCAGTDVPRVLFVRSHAPLCVAGGSTYEDDLINTLGAVNCTANSRVRYPHYAVESLIRIDPQIVIDATFYDTPTAAEKKQIKTFWTQLQSISAVKNKRVYIIKTDIHSVPGPRTPDLLRILAQILTDGAEPIVSDMVLQVIE